MITYKNACEEICEEAEEWEPEVGGEEEDVVEEVILPGVDWESVCYQVLNFYIDLWVSIYLNLGERLLSNLSSTSSEKGSFIFFFFILVAFLWCVSRHLDYAGVRLPS